MKSSILVAVNDSMSSNATIDYLINMALRPEDVHITLSHVFIKPSAGDELMGEKFMKEQPKRLLKVLEDTKQRLVEGGYTPDNITIELLSEHFDTVADGIISTFKKGEFNMVVIGRKRMSKAEEFVLGDPSIKLVRALEGTAILVVKMK